MNVSNVCVKRARPVWLGLLVLGLTAPALAADLPAAAPGPLATTGKVMASLVLILLMIAGMALLARRLQNLKWMQNGRQDDVVIRAGGVLNLGVKEKLLVVDVGGKRLLLGVTAQQITTLAELPCEHSPSEIRVSTLGADTETEDAGAEEPSKATSSQPVSSAFADLLKKTLARV